MKYRDRFRNKAKVRFACKDEAECLVCGDSVMCPLPLELPQEKIDRSSHVCVTPFEEELKQKKARA